MLPWITTWISQITILNDNSADVPLKSGLDMSVVNSQWRVDTMKEWYDLDMIVVRAITI